MRLRWVVPIVVVVVPVMVAVVMVVVVAVGLPMLLAVGGMMSRFTAQVVVGVVVPVAASAWR